MSAGRTLEHLVVDIFQWERLAEDSTAWRHEIHRCLRRAEEYLSTRADEKRPRKKQTLYRLKQRNFMIKTGSRQRGKKRQREGVKTLTLVTEQQLETNVCSSIISPSHELKAGKKTEVLCMLVQHVKD
ncbi:hypothetical protein ElyMa_000499900 [Elysia marginata]|uniref:Uncharacterized protein n=1 Tax=Elysia marginata TaxID=1093978 RepID=A0AAV4FVD7_9GAST|nr:hypothetical protein ElyMa_000499900 [Elysia marginata]